MRYLKAIIAFIMLELMVGKIGFEYGYGYGVSKEGIGSIYAFAVYVVLYLIFCIYEIHNEPSLRKNIISVIYLAAPCIIFIILACVSDVRDDDLGFAVTLFVVFGLALVAEIVTLVLRIIEGQRDKKRMRQLIDEQPR